MWCNGKKYLLGCFLVIILGVCVLGCRVAYGAGMDATNGGTDEDFQVIVLYGNNESMQDSHFIPLEIRFENGSQPFQGELQLAVPYMQWDNLLYTQSVDLQAGERETYFFSVPLQQEVSELSLQVVNKSGEAVYSYQIHFPPSIGDEGMPGKNAITVGVIGLASSENVYVSEHVMQSGQTNTFWNYSLERSEIRPSLGALLMYDVLVLSLEQYDALSAPCKSILQQWTFTGGLLVVNGVTQFYIDTQVYPLQGLHSEELGELAYSYAGDGLCLYVFEEMDFAATDGLGQLKSILDVLCLHFENRFTPQVLGGSFQGGWQNQLQELLMGWQYQFPNVLPYIFVITVYILIALPLSYLFLKSRRKSHYLRGTVISLALCFSCTIYVMGAETRMVVPHMTALTIESVQGDVWNQTAYGCVQTPYQGTVTLKVAEDYSSGVLMLENRDVRPEEHRGLTSSYAIVSAGADRPTYFVGSHTVGTNYLSFHKSGEATDYGLAVSAEQIQNNTSHTLLWVGYVSEEQCRAYTALSPGETAALQSGSTFSVDALKEQLEQADLEETLISLFLCYYESHPELFAQGGYWVGLYQEREGVFIEEIEDVVYQGYGLLIQSAEEYDKE